MTKELKALERIKHHCVVSTEYFYEHFGEDLDIIETALKDYENKTKLAKEYKDVNNVAKRLKALEIIKEKICLNKFDKSKTTNYYLYTNEELTQEEYDLLKEVLL